MEGNTSNRDISSIKCANEVLSLMDMYNLASIGPAIFIVLVLSFLSKRKSFKKQIWSGRPGLVTPLDYFSGQKNRISIAMAFGATAAECLKILFQLTTKRLPGPAFLDGFESLVIVLHFGIILYPFFACLTTEHVLVGSCFGLLYTFARFVVSMVASLKCARYYGHARTAADFLSELPVLICLLFLVIRFAMLLYLNIRKRQSNDQQISFENSRLATPENFKYVHKLLFQPARCSELRAPWFIRLRNFIYKPNPDFKFSTQMLSTVVVSTIILYQLLVAVVYGSDIMNKLCSSSLRNNPVLGVLCLPAIKYSFFATLVLSTILSIVHIGHMLACHRRHVYLLYHSRKLFFKGQVYSPAKLVGRSLSYCGYQIAYIIWGFIVVSVSLFFIIFVIASIVTLWTHNKTLAEKYLLSFILRALPFITFTVCIWGFQFGLSVFVFRDRSFPNITVTVDNRQVYCIVAFFFFFFNIVKGFFACFAYILKSALLGIVFLARIDRTSMIEGFYSWDPGYMAYLGHVYFYVAHHHPVLLVFCQLLKDRKINQSNRFLESFGIEEASLTGISSPRPKGARFSALGYKRWFLAWTLIKNPGLISQRSRKIRATSRPVSFVDSPVGFSDEKALVGQRI